jgi:tripartite-type tricarboxylate transporter receptor subunit TctC
MRALLLLLLAAWSAVHAVHAFAQAAYPPRPVRMLVGFAPGGTTDIIARLLAPELSDAFDRPFYVENRPGATGNIATEIAAKTVPDGTTLLVVAASFASNVSLYSRTNYDPLRDFAPITRVAAVNNVLVVHPALPVKSVKDLIELAKRYPGEVTFASPGHGSTPHLAL